MVLLARCTGAGHVGSRAVELDHLFVFVDGPSEAEEALTTARAFMQRNIAEPTEFQRIYELLRAAMPGDDPFWVTWRGWAWRHGLLDEKTTP